jgi:hypothetical protein
MKIWASGCSPDPHLLSHQTWEDRKVSGGRNPEQPASYSNASSSTAASNSGAGGNVHTATARQLRYQRSDGV